MSVLKNYSWKKFTAIYEETPQNLELYRAIEMAIKTENINITKRNEALLLKQKDEPENEVNMEEEFNIQNVTILKKFHDMNTRKNLKEIIEQTSPITRSK
jgi:ribosomal protein L24